MTRNKGLGGVGRGYPRIRGDAVDMDLTPTVYLKFF